MISDCDKRSSIKSLRSASLVSSLFESATSIIHPLERLEPNVENEIESPKTAERVSLFDSTQLLSHVGSRSVSSRSSDIKKSVQHKR